MPLQRIGGSADSLPGRSSALPWSNPASPARSATRPSVHLRACPERGLGGGRMTCDRPLPSSSCPRVQARLPGSAAVTVAFLQELYARAQVGG